ncbi:MAG: hypothetical protein KDK60_03950 [Chlamydiia bacterium]|nr:hypothetical protein [Chlamydiia bacterium]
MEDELMNEIIKAHDRSFQRAFEVAVRTGTALIFEKEGKIIKVKPPYRYEMVPIPESERGDENLDENS